MKAYSELDWRRLFLAVPFTDEVFSLEALQQALGAKKLPDEWLLNVESDPKLHAHVYLDGPNPKPDHEQASPEKPSSPESTTLSQHYFLDIRVYHSPPPSPESVTHGLRVEFLRFERFLSAVAAGFAGADSIPEEVGYAAHAVVYASSESASWRLPLLADPPKLAELPSEMGSVSLAGVRLRFDGGPAGLQAAELETRREGAGHRLALSFQGRIPLARLDGLLAATFNRMESLASFFLDFATSPEAASQ